jgi:hypothetical protein
MVVRRTLSWLREASPGLLDYGAPVFTDDVASSIYPVFNGPATLVSAEDNAGHHCYCAEQLE